MAHTEYCLYNQYKKDVQLLAAEMRKKRNETMDNYSSAVASGCPHQAPRKNILTKEYPALPKFDGPLLHSCHWLKSPA